MLAILAYFPIARHYHAERTQASFIRTAAFLVQAAGQSLGRFYHYVYAVRYQWIGCGLESGGRRQFEQLGSRLCGLLPALPEEPFAKFDERNVLPFPQYVLQLLNQWSRRKAVVQ